MWSMQMTIFWIYSCSVSLTRKRFFFYICVELSSSFFIDSDVVAISRSVAFMVVERQRLVFRIEAIERLLVNSVFFLLSINSISCSDQFNFRATAGSRFRMPQIKAKPNLDTLKVSVSFMRVWEIERERAIFLASRSICVYVSMLSSCRPMQCIRASNMDQVLVRMARAQWPGGRWWTWSTIDRMVWAHRMERLHSRNAAKSTTITYQTTRRVYSPSKRRFSAGHFRGMGIILWPPVKVNFDCIHLLASDALNRYFVFSISFPHLPHTMTDSVIRIHDSSTPQYKRVNEIAAKNINWCILDVAFSPNGQYFAYSTWSSSSKYTSARHSTIFNRF